METGSPPLTLGNSEINSKIACIIAIAVFLKRNTTLTRFSEAFLSHRRKRAALTAVSVPEVTPSQSCSWRQLCGAHDYR